MPIEIRELIIKTTVDNAGASGSTNSAPAGGVDESKINEITDKVLEIIKEKSER